MADYHLYLETSVRGYHAYVQNLSKDLNLGEIFYAEHDSSAVMHDPNVMRYAQSDGETVGHIPKYLSRLCFQFVEDGGEIDAEVIGKRFNAGKGMGLEVPVEIRFTGNHKYLRNFRAQLVQQIKQEFESKAVRKTILKTLQIEKSNQLH